MARSTSALAARDGAFGAVVDPTLLARLDLAPGARIAVGAATFEITAVIKSEPDKLASGIAFGPRMIVSEAALRATGLLQPGSLVRWHYRLRLPDGSDRAADAVVSDATAQLPDAGWQVRTRTNASPSLERNVERFTQFLTLVGLTALLVGGVGVANAVKSHIDRKRDVIATLKALGATGGRVFAIYLFQVALLSSIGAAIGLALGAALAVRDRRVVRRRHTAADCAGAASGRTRRWHSVTGCSRRSPSRSGRSAARTTSRSRRCFATRSRRAAAGRAAAMWLPPRSSLARLPPPR